MKALEFGQYIRDLRKEKKLTIRQLELYSGVSNSYLSLLENGKRAIPSPEILKKLANALNVKYETLMFKAGYIDVPNEEDWEELTSYIAEVSTNEGFEKYKKLLVSLFELLESLKAFDRIDKTALTSLEHEFALNDIRLPIDLFRDQPFEAVKQALQIIKIKMIAESEIKKIKNEDNTSSQNDNLALLDSELKKSIIEDVLSLSEEDAEYIAGLIRRIRKSDDRQL